MFRTELSIAPATDQLARTARILTAGSCFADSIGARLTTNKVDTLVNPFGTVFQPLALAKLLRAAAGEEVDWQQHVVEARGRWQSYDLHGSIGADSPVSLLQHIQELVRRTGEFLRQADVVLLTLGTAWAYRLRETGELVNNCHKQTADLFVKELLTPDEIINGLAETHAYLRRINPNLRFVLTVSPVRHLKDTLPMNSVSKSVLRVATHVVSDLLPGVAYFPAFELLMDDLRDYRFYASDMLHPSEVAEDYVWDKFARTYFDVDFGRFRKEWAAVRQSLGHRPLHEGAPEHREFLENTLQKLEQLSLRKVEVATELNEVRSKIAVLPVPKQPEPATISEDDEERIDIGEDSAPNIALPVAPQPAATTPVTGNPSPRLSPEEFRSQRGARSGRPERGRRDGRGKGQPQLPSENEQFQTSAAFASESTELDHLPTPLLLVPGALGTAEQALEQTAVPTAVELGAALGEEEPAKKKKRRSRGGAKRTARKHALRLAAEEGSPDAGPTSAPDIAATPASGEAGEADKRLVESKKGSTIMKSTPVKRGGQRNETGRVPRVELYAPAVEAPGGVETPAPHDAAFPTLEATVPRVEAPAIIADAAISAAANPKSRNTQNRGRNKPTPLGNVEAGDVSATSPLVAPAEPSAAPVIGTAEQLSGTSGPVAAGPNNRNRGTRGKQLPAAAVPEIGASVPEVAAPEIMPAPARRSNRAKRAVSGARPEKPAVDTPVIPVRDELELRTQVAAGRMTGSAATLIEPVATVPDSGAEKKAATTKKPVSSKAKPVRTVGSKLTTTTEAEAKPLKKIPPAAKAKPAAKPKASAAKAPAAKTTAAKAAAKPKAPRKPTNSA